MLLKKSTPWLFSHFRSNAVAFDTEGTGLIPYGPPAYWGYHPARPFFFAFCDYEGNTECFRWKVDPATRRVIPGTKAEIDILKRLAHDARIQLIGHNIAYDFRMVSATIEEPITTRHVDDTMVLAHVVTAGDELSYALKPLCKKYLSFDDADEKALEREVAMARSHAKAQGWLIAGGKKEVERGDHVVFAGNKPIKADYWLVPSPDCRIVLGSIDHTASRDHDKVLDYGVGDVERAMLLYRLMVPRLDDDPRIRATYAREMQLFWVLRRMEQRGTRVYPGWTMELIRWYERYMVKMQKMADLHGGAGMNFMSPKQLCKKFYTEKGISPMYTDMGQQYLDAGDLEHAAKHMTLGKDRLAELGGVDEYGEYKDPLAKAVLEWRAAKQSIKSFLNIYAKFWYPLNIAQTSKYYDPAVGWPSLYSKGTWILHPNYNQCGAVTGRMSCSDPNLLQVASETTGLRKADIPARPRECFGPRPGCLWYLPDYSQVEVWAFAFMSKEQNMQELLLSGYDFHQGVADKSFTRKSDYQERKKYYRKLAKLIMFGKLYGGGVGTREKPGRMTRLLQMPFEEAKAFIDSFEEQFSSVVRYMRRMTDEASRQGEAWNLYGRRYKLERQWAYKVVNYLIQGTCADLLKVAIMRVDWMLEHRWHHPDLGLLNAVHDELIIEVPYSLHSQRLMREIIWVMQMDSTHIGIPVPLPVGIKIARKDWSHTSDVEIPKWVRGGIPRDETPFDELRQFMEDCPYTVDASLKGAA
jgi:DNA polymerase-1